MSSSDELKVASLFIVAALAPNGLVSLLAMLAYLMTVLPTVRSFVDSKLAKVLKTVSKNSDSESPQGNDTES